eukprot:97003_1
MSSYTWICLLELIFILSKRLQTKCLLYSSLYSISIISTFLYTTSVASDFYSTSRCDYYSNRTYSILPTQNILNSIIIKDNRLRIEFDVKIYNYCNKSLCNILYISNRNHSESLSLSINPIENYFEISVVNDFVSNHLYRIYKSDTLLPQDNQNHHIYLLFMYPSDGFHTNIFSVDNTVYYYYSTSLKPSTQLYDLYQLSISNSWYNTINAKLSNVCIKSSILELFDGEAKCGETLTTDIISSSDIDIFYFNLSNNTNPSWVLFDSCATDSDTHLALYDFNFKILYKSDVGDCYGREQLIIEQLYPGEYILGISGWPVLSLLSVSQSAHKTVTVICRDTADVNDGDDIGTYELIHPDGYWHSWWEAESDCELFVGTSLATIITEQDMHEAINVMTFGAPFTIAWIGMYRFSPNRNKWQWIDGTNCDYTSTGNCIDDVHWYNGEPNDSPPNVYVSPPMGVYLEIANLSSGYRNSVEFQVINAALCNAQNSKYSIKNCNNVLKCWKKMNCCHDSDLISDTAGIRYDVYGQRNFIYKPPIAYWDSRLFIIGMNAIHYTTFQLFDNEYVWHNTSYIHNNSYQHGMGELGEQFYAQDQNSLYLYAQNRNGWLIHTESGDAVLVHIDLNTLDVKSYMVPEAPDYVQFGNLRKTYCMVAGNNHSYIVGDMHMDIFDANTRAWIDSFFPHQNGVDVCAHVIHNNGEFIYMLNSNSFMSDALRSIIKYHVDSGSVEYFDTPNVCNSGSIFYSDYSPTLSITGRDDRIYFHGCYLASWKTIVFNIKRDEFDIETIDIDVPTNPSKYTPSQMTVFDDNILLMVHATANDISLYSAVTHLISMNFQNTKIISPVWPSDGFIIKYYLNDLTNLTTDIYHVLFYCNDTINNINASIILNTSNDDCVCNETVYKCYDCHQHFDLTQYLSVQDNFLDVLTFSTTYYVNSNALILPNYIKIELERCRATFDEIDKFTNTDDPSITFRFNLTNNCYNKNNVTNFSMTITSLQINMSTEIFIGKTCKICRYRKMQCDVCNGNLFTIYHETDDIETGDFDVMIQSNMIDFIVYPSKVTIQ